MKQEELSALSILFLLMRCNPSAPQFYRRSRAALFEQTRTLENKSATLEVLDFKSVENGWDSIIAELLLMCIAC